MVTSWETPPLSDLHMLVLGRIGHRAIADVEDIARWLGVPVAIADTVCADLEAAGLLAKVRRHAGEQHILVRGDGEDHE